MWETGCDLPDAPAYVVLCLDAGDVDKWYAHLETGFAAGNVKNAVSAARPYLLFCGSVPDDREIANIFKVIGKYLSICS